MGASPLHMMVEMAELRIGRISPSVRAALLAVDRAKFVQPEHRAMAYEDQPVPLTTPHGHAVATVSAPHAYALGFDALGLAEGDRLLELGSGSGYGAALASEVVGPSGFVTTVEVDPYLHALTTRLDADRPNVRALHDDGLARPDLVRAHDKCWLTFAVEEIPTAIVDAIPEGGVLVAPVGPLGSDQRLVRLRRSGGVIHHDDLGAVRFVGARARID